MAAHAISTSAPEFAEAGLRELRRAAPGLEVATTLAPGITLLAAPGRFAELAERVRARPPIFVRHLCPVDLSVDLAALPEARGVPEALAEQAALLAPRLDPALRFSVQTRRVAGDGPFGPFDVNRALAEALQAAAGALLDVRAPEQVLSVVLASERAYLGLSRVEENLSAWAGGARRFARTPDQVSRSEFKLLEALEVFDPAALGVAGARHRPPAAAPRALDLGAAPGGWTRILRERGFRVVAVDPAALDPRVAADPGVRHVPLTAQEFLRHNRERFDLLVNDMRLDARDSARLMRAAARALTPEARALMTLKLPTRDPEAVMHRALALLLGPYRLLGARQLFHNRQEVTVALTPRGAPPRGD